MKFGLQAMLGFSVGCSVLHKDGCTRWIQCINMKTKAEENSKKWHHEASSSPLPFLGDHLRIECQRESVCDFLRV